jgi:hypothetical protein
MTQWSANEWSFYKSDSSYVEKQGIGINWYEVERFILFPYFLNSQLIDTSRGKEGGSKLM